MTSPLSAKGDSASSTEIYAILSELSELALRQNIAVTGSVNQQAEIQAISGVNQKVERFFDECKAKGLTEKQGVIIIHQNVDDLMIRFIFPMHDSPFSIYFIRKPIF